jgi:hypothetical protein
MQAERKGDHCAALRTLEAAISEHPHLYQPYMAYVQYAFLSVSRMMQAPSSDMGAVRQTIRSIQKAARQARDLGAPEEPMHTAEVAIAKIEEVLRRLGI